MITYNNYKTVSDTWGGIVYENGEITTFFINESKITCNL